MIGNSNIAKTECICNEIGRFPEGMDLYAILKEFRKGHSHMAVVMRENNPSDLPNDTLNGEATGGKI